MNETRIGIKAESQVVVRVTAGAPLSEALSLVHEPGNPDFLESPTKKYLKSLKGFAMSRHPDKFEIDEFVRFSDGIKGLSAVGSASLDLTDELALLREHGKEGRPIGIRFGLDISRWPINEVMLARPLFRAGRNDDAETAAKAEAVYEKAKSLGYLPLLYTIDRPSRNIEFGFDAIRASLKAGAKVTELLIVPDNPAILNTDHFPDRREISA